MGLAPDILTKGVRRRVLRVPKGSPMYALATSHSSRVQNPAPGFNTPSALQRYVSAPDLTVKEVAEGTLSMLAVRAGSETSSGATCVTVLHECKCVNCACKCTSLACCLAHVSRAGCRHQVQ